MPAGRIHGHQVFVQEVREIDVVLFLQPLDHADDVIGRVIPDVAPVAEDHVIRAALVLLDDHVARCSEVPAVTTYQAAAKACVDVDAAPAAIGILAEQRGRVLEIDLFKRKQIPCRLGQDVELGNDRPRVVEDRHPTCVAPDHTERAGKIHILLVDLGQHLWPGDESLADDAEVDLGNPFHDLLRHAGKEAAAGDQISIGGRLPGNPAGFLDEVVGGGQAADGNDVPVVRTVDLGQDAEALAPSVCVVNLHLVAVVHRDGRQQRYAIRDVSGHILFAHYRIDKKYLSHWLEPGSSGRNPRLPCTPPRIRSGYRRRCN